MVFVPASSPVLSVVVPVHNERDNVLPLIDEIRTALADAIDYEIVVVDDCSSDDTLEILREAMKRVPQLRVFRHRNNSGQSTALLTGVKMASASIIATLDGDGQNDPADIRALWNRWREESSSQDVPLLVTGWRAARRDTWLRRISSKIANGVRGRMLGDGTPDTGCGLKVFARDTFLQLPYFDHMHRFLPALTRRQGGRVISVAVNHRPRLRGSSHYGVWNRLWVGIVDLFGVMWLRRRTRLTDVDAVVLPSTRNSHGS